MATVTSTPTATSLSISGRTTVNGTISWSLPSVPSEGTVTSRVLSGTVNISMSRGNCGTLTVNGESITCEDGATFEIDLGASSTVTSVATSGAGNNNNARGTVTFTNLVYTVTYQMPLATYTVTFVDWDGTVLKTQEVEEGSNATPPSNPSRDGYAFTGWDKSYTNVTSNLTVNALYEKISINLDKSDITLAIGESTKVLASVIPIDLKCVWSISNDNVLLETNVSASDTLYIYGNDINLTTNYCTVSKTYNSFTLTSYDTSNYDPTIQFNIEGLNQNETYTFYANLSEGVAYEVYYSDGYVYHDTNEPLSLEGYTSYTFNFYNKNGTTYNWSVSDISLTDSTGDDKNSNFNSLEVTVTGAKVGNSILYCKSELGNVTEVCNITVYTKEEKINGIKMGNIEISNVYMGNTKISKIYLGNNLIYEK